MSGGAEHGRHTLERFVRDVGVAARCGNLHALVALHRRRKNGARGSLARVMSGSPPGPPLNLAKALVQRVHPILGTLTRVAAAHSKRLMPPDGAMGRLLEDAEAALSLIRAHARATAAVA